MKIYLDTNIIRSTHNHFNDEPHISQAIIACSYLNIFEILSGMNEKEYFIRRAMLRNVFSSKVEIKWKEPREILGSCFRVLRAEASDSTNHFKLAKEVCKCESYREAKGLQNELDIEQLIELDKKIGEHANSEIESNYTRMVEEVGLSVRDEARKEIDNEGGVLTLSLESKENILQQMISKHANLIYQMANGKNYGYTVDELIRSYDGTLDVYFCASIYCQIKKLIFGNALGKNDYFDVSHFLYIDQNIASIVSRDKLVKNICLSFFPQKYTDPERFYSMMGWKNGVDLAIPGSVDI